MKIIPAVLLVLFASCARGREATYIGSTPAAPAVRTFLGIPLRDSVDFIRWKVNLQDDKFTLSCNYGIGKPNTNGFLNGGKWIELNGAFRKEKNYYFLHYSNKKLGFIELNTDLLHLLNSENNLLVGNGGWSYTLNNIIPKVTSQISVAAKQTSLKDSMAFKGRTPCRVSGIIAPGRECYKLKWYVVFYSNSENNKPRTYKVLGTPWRKEGGRIGTWEIVKGMDGRTIYQLNDENGNAWMDLVKLDENILVFTDKQGKLLVGNEDFSYTLNRKW
jgi:hypothetical protein